MMKRLKTMLAVIKPGDTFFARHDDGNATPSSVSEGGGEAHLRHTANPRASHLGERGRHDRARRRARNPRTAVGPAHPGRPRSHRY
ncbi:hypothetical protein SAMN05446635_5384 [Burkholderia sp. OK233]|nr:hypothetical protein SAMN05446635_4796 [Burkholderia sp. OK233]SOE74623.1 hypothetical protein SAMN05446635_5384 [Burkholderia sp. OK233]